MLWAIIIGLIVGAIAKLVMPGKAPGGIIVTILLGIAGSFVGTLIGRTLGFYGSGQGAGIIMSILGAVLLLWIYRMILARRTTPYPDRAGSRPVTCGCARSRTSPIRAYRPGATSIAAGATTCFAASSRHR